MTMTPPGGPGWTDSNGNPQAGSPPPGWWQASDMRWYPAETHPNYQPEPQAGPPQAQPPQSQPPQAAPQFTPPQPAEPQFSEPQFAPPQAGPPPQLGVPQASGAPPQLGGPQYQGQPAYGAPAPVKTGGANKLVWVALAGVLLLGGCGALVAVGATIADDADDDAVETAALVDTGSDDGESSGSDSGDREQAEPGSEADDFKSCTRIDEDYYEVEVINQSPNTSTYSFDIAFYDDAGVRVGDTFDLVNDLVPNRVAIETKVAFIDSPWVRCELLDLDRYESTSDPDELAEVSCEITGADFFDDIEGTVTAVNGTPEDSDYLVTVAFVDAEGVRRGSTSSYIERVRPDETALSDLFTSIDFADDLRCEIVGVQRTASL